MTYRLWQVSLQGQLVILQAAPIKLADVDPTAIALLAYELNKYATEKLEEYGIELRVSNPPRVN